MLTNVGLHIVADDVGARFGASRSRLLNDLEAMASAIEVLAPDEIVSLQNGTAVANGTVAVIAAGTGLGEAYLQRVDDEWRPVPTEAGHADFAARTDRELELVRMLRERYGRAEIEQVISGRGLLNLHRFTHRGGQCAVVDNLDFPDAAALVSQAALGGRCQGCADALKMFVSAYGAEAGNLALRDDGHGRPVHRRRHRPEDPARDHQRQLHGRLPRQGADDGCSREDSGQRDRQRAHRTPRRRCRRPATMNASRGARRGRLQADVRGGRLQAARFPARILAQLHDSKYLRIRAGSDHRFIGIWVVVVSGRVFVRSWNDKPDGWYRAFLDEPRGAILIGEREIPIRARRAATARVVADVEAAYAEKYTTAAARKYVLGFKRPRRRATTTELIPAPRSMKKSR